MSYFNSTIDTYCKLFGPYLEWTNKNIYQVHQQIAPDICSYATQEHDGVNSPVTTTSCYAARITRCQEMLHALADRINKSTNTIIPGYDKVLNVAIAFAGVGFIGLSAKKIYQAFYENRYTDLAMWALLGGAASYITLDRIRNTVGV